MATISDAESRTLERIRRVIEEDRVDFTSFQCPRCGQIGGLDVAQLGDGPEVMFRPCQHQLHGDIAEAYLVKAFPGGRRG